MPNSKGYNGTNNRVCVDLNSGNGDPILVDMSSGYPLPTLTSFAPQTSQNDQAISMTLDGGPWIKGATVELIGPVVVSATSVEWLGKDRIVAEIDLFGVQGGDYDVVVTNPVNGCVVEVDGFYIEAVVAVDAGTPLQFALRQNYPNPFNPSTTISFDVSAKAHSTLTIYNVNGQAVRTLVNGVLEPRSYVVSWDGTDEHGQAVASGVYFYRLESGSFQDVRKLTLLK